MLPFYLTLYKKVYTLYSCHDTGMWNLSMETLWNFSATKLDILTRRPMENTHFSQPPVVSGGTANEVTSWLHYFKLTWVLCKQVALSVIRSEPLRASPSYSRQSRWDHPHVPVSAELFLLEMTVTKPAISCEAQHVPVLSFHFHLLFAERSFGHFTMKR